MMKRRAVVSCGGVAVLSSLAGCAGLDRLGDGDQSTVNPAFDATPSRTEVGDWTLDRPGLTHAAVYENRLVTVQPVEKGTQITGSDPESGNKKYETSLDEMVAPPSTLSFRPDETTGVLLDGSAVVALDPESGERRWSLDSPGDIQYRNESTLFVFRGEEERVELIVLDSNAWTERCRIDLTPPLESYGDDYVLLVDDSASQSGDDTDGERVICHETKTGSKLWEAVPEVESGRLLSERLGRTLLVTDEKRVVVRDFATGDVRYTQTPDGVLGRLWASDGERAYFGNWTGGVPEGDSAQIRAFDTDGETWHRVFDADAALPRYWSQRLYVQLGQDHERTARLDPQTGETVWKRNAQLLATDESAAYLAKGTQLARVDSTGEIEWQTSLDFEYESQNAMFWRPIGDTFLAWTPTELAGFDTATGEERTRVSGLPSLRGVARHYGDAAEPETDRVFLVFDDSVTALSV